VQGSVLELHAPMETQGPRAGVCVKHHVGRGGLDMPVRSPHVAVIGNRCFPVACRTGSDAGKASVRAAIISESEAAATYGGMVLQGWKEKFHTGANAPQRDDPAAAVEEDRGAPADHFAA